MKIIAVNPFVRSSSSIHLLAANSKNWVHIMVSHVGSLGGLIFWEEEEEEASSVERREIQKVEIQQQRKQLADIVYRPSAFNTS